MERLSPRRVRTSSVVLPVRDKLGIVVASMIAAALVLFVVACLVLMLRLSVSAGLALLLVGAILSIGPALFSVVRRMWRGVRRPAPSLPRPAGKAAPPSGEIGLSRPL